MSRSQESRGLVAVIWRGLSVSFAGWGCEKLRRKMADPSNRRWLLTRAVFVVPESLRKSSNRAKAGLKNGTPLLHV
jgi:hypothetical protein